ncbi:hypothetical protein BD289DRAFT_164406 [Coniella lustricola]|uniref:Uncharacterized protein n=1 Tax=Coniella lustricola TaxID=2025994 RepID=A0A2T2ZUD1_9PEZI|nr:hypothetical protein BD289DRAFT_164406 [Coniella lustricola]
MMARAMAVVNIGVRSILFVSLFISLGGLGHAALHLVAICRQDQQCQRQLLRNRLSIQLLQAVCCLGLCVRVLLKRSNLSPRSSVIINPYISMDMCKHRHYVTQSLASGILAR